MSGPTIEAIKYRFDNDRVQTENICYSEYLERGGNGMRVVLVPLTTLPDGGTVQIQRFGAFFIRDIPQPGAKNELHAEFIYAIVPGSGGGGGGGATSFSLRLVE
jgi:hypothetical protein